MAKATLNMYFDTRKGVNGSGIIKWSVICERTPRLYTTGLKASADEWAFLQTNKTKLDNRIKDEVKRALWFRVYGDTFIDESGKEQAGYFKRAQTIINQLGDQFTFDAFADELANYGKVKEAPAEKTDLVQALLDMGASMRKQNRIGNAQNFEFAAKSLARFVESFSDEERKEFLSIPIPRGRKQTRPVAVLRFEHLTPDFLTTYEQWMLHYGKRAQRPNAPSSAASLTTVGIYLRHVRAVVNDAIQAGIMPREKYPFGTNGYLIPAGVNTKKALSKADIDRIKAFECLPGSMEQRSLDLWLFSYYSNGANLTDICHLTWANVDLKQGEFYFIRQKTARSKKQKQSTITAYLRPETLAIIERLGTNDRNPANFVFPFLTPDMDTDRRKKTVQQVIKMTNKWMSRIGEQLGIDSNMGTYSARHSFATVLLKSKSSLAFISKQLGHTNLKTTESYLGSFDDAEAREFLKAL